MTEEDVLDQNPEDEVLDAESEEADDADGEGDEASDEEPSLEKKLKAAIDVQTEDIGPLRKKLTLTVPRDLIGERLDNQYGELRRDAMVPGFRKGRAPRRLLEKRFGHEVSETLVQQLVGAGYLAAIDKTELKVVADPLIWVKDKEGDGESLVEVQEAIERIELPEGDAPLTFSAEIEVRPEFEMPELKGIPLVKPVVTITDADVQTHLDRLRGVRGEYENLPEGPAEKDDVVIADVKMTCGEAVVKEQESVRLAARPQTLEGISFDNLGDVLQGAKPGETRTLSGQVPEDYDKTEFRGKPADFEIKVREVRRLRLPEVDEAFIKQFGFDSEKELREWLRADLESRVGEQIRRGLAGQARRYLLDNATFELPERLSQRQANRVIIRRMIELYRQGVPRAEVEKHMDELKTGAQEESIRDLKLTFIMEKLAEDREVEVTEGEINSQIAVIAQQQGRRFDRVRDELMRDGGLQNLYFQLRDEKLVQQLVEAAEITEKAPGDVDKVAAGESNAGKKTEDPGDELADET